MASLLPPLPPLPSIQLPSLSLPSFGGLGGGAAASGSSAPASQKAGDRPISFLLDNPSSGQEPAFFDFVIRPEELTWTETSRLSVNQTLGGAWADNFGASIPTINLSGHTGWHKMGIEKKDGLDRFVALKETVFDGWHLQRQQSINDGQDPNQVRLIFSDALDSRAVVVAPQSFTLRRSKSRPLLAQFQISLLVMDEALELPSPAQQFGFNGASGKTPGPLGAIAKAAGLASLAGSIKGIAGMISGVRSLVQSSILGPIQSFMSTAVSVFSAVKDVISSGVGLVKDVVSTAQAIAQVGVTAFRTLAAIASIPQQVKAGLMAISSAFSNVACVLKNALSAPEYYSDYSDVFGASNCSSTSGGRPPSPLADENPLYKVVPPAAPAAYGMSPSGSAAMQSLLVSDPVLNPLPPAAVGSALQAVSSGLSRSALLA